MKIYRVLQIFLAVYLFGHATSRAQDNKIPITDLQTPNSPAFILLDASPTSIEHPTTAKAFGINLINNVQQAGGFPRNFGVEVSPFWFFRHPNLTPEKFYGIKKDTVKNGDDMGRVIYVNNIGGQAKLVALSLASVSQVDSVSKLNYGFISVGARSTLVRIMRKTVVRQFSILDSLDKEVSRLNKLIKPNMADSLVEKILDSAGTSARAYGASLHKLYKTKPAFIVEAAIGYSVAFENYTVSNRAQQRLGGWLTASGSIGLNKPDRETRTFLNILAVGRYLDNQYYKVKERDETYFDTGIRVEFERDRLWIGYERVQRSNQTNTSLSTFRSVGLIKYKLSESLFLTGSFGRNFGGTNNLISLLGLNWGIGNGKESLDVPKSE